MAKDITFESVLIAGEEIEPGLLIWRRYRVDAPGVVEMFLDINPQLRHHLATSLYLPVGVSVIIPIVQSVLKRRPAEAPTVRPFGNV